MSNQEAMQKLGNSVLADFGTEVVAACPGAGDWREQDNNELF